MSELRELVLSGHIVTVRFPSGLCRVEVEESGRVDDSGAYITLGLPVVYATYTSGWAEGVTEAICAADSPYLDEWWTGASLVDVQTPDGERVPLTIDLLPPQHRPEVAALIADAAAGDPGEAGE